MDIDSKMAETSAASWENHYYVSHDGVPDDPCDDDSVKAGSLVLSPSAVGSLVIEDSDDGREAESLKELLYDYSQRTTLHGYAYLASPTPYILRRVLWGLYIFACSFGFVIYTYSQLRLFLEFRKNSLVQVEFRNTVKFPAVTVCNQNPFKFTSSIESDWYETAKFLATNINFSQPIKNRACSSDEFTCLEDGSCLSEEQWCDGFPDCAAGSDEKTCDRCPLIYLDDGGQNSSLAFNRQYVYFDLLNIFDRHLYISKDGPFVYLYDDGYTWYLADGLGQSAAVYATVTSEKDRPEELGTQSWSVNSQATPAEWRDVNVEVTCDLNFKWLLDTKIEEVDDQLNMSMLYRKSGHVLEDFIRRCVWKGDSCEDVGNITTVMTDIGLCYTLSFVDSEMDHPGVGYGLSMTFNIEQYEYIKDAKDGIGIKLLLHEPNEFPMMADDGLAIPPGLVSFIAVESTTVDNLPAPWGSCGVKQLQYFDAYSESRCHLECEAKLISSICGCTPFYMPYKESDPDICDVGTYGRCILPALDRIRATNSCQECIEPCEKDVFATTTSFALMLANLGGEQDLRRYTLSQRLLEAREARFRHIQEHYKETMRQFDLMDQKLAQLRKLLDLLEWKMNEDYEVITAYSMLVNSDCKTSRDMLSAVRQTIDTEMIKRLEEFRARLLNLLAKQFPNVLSLTDGLTEVIENARVEYGLGTDPLIMDFATCKADCRTTLEGYDYDGNRSTTVSGLACQRWDSQTPHQHPYTAMYDDRFPEGNLVDASNFCRNPDKEPTGPWCYTTNPDVERETCLIPICSDCRNVGGTYRGNRRLTLSGRTCQRWDSQSPHPHNYNSPDYFPDDSLAETSNFCRNPDNKPTGPWCYTTDPEVTWETCAIPMCHDCKMKSLGTDYVGTKAVTRTGRPCQRWDMQYPHRHTFTNVTYFPDHTLADASNFCRNPDFKDVGPWCFTTDPNRIWEPCGIPFCSKCKLHNDEKGQLYDGTQSFTIFGRACQRWDSQTPHSHSYTSDDMFVDGSVSAASNYCRNPDPSTHSAPWCYTTHPDFEWEPCDISLCNDCLETSLGLKYNGNKAITSSSRPCQRWDSQYPHKHPYKDATNFVDSSLFEANNFCRNPDSSKGGPWCYTTDPEVEREYCDIPECSSCRMDDWGRAYKGLATTTKSGLSCQRWDSQSPHPHESFPMDNFPDGTLQEAANYCRNPDLKQGVGPWCYTTDPGVTWEGCGIPLCYTQSDCILTEIGTDYQGSWSLTASGKTCQRWDSQSPHKHNFTNPDLFPEDSLTDVRNYCRNPDRKAGVGPWCYTAIPGVEWESCGLPMCLGCLKGGETYDGEQSFTQSGLKCQNWISQYPHAHPYSFVLSAEEDYCRNPNNDTSGPWCYTTDVTVTSEPCGIWFCSAPDCRVTEVGGEYRGRRSFTMSGYRCQRWDVQEPHAHPFTDPELFPDATLAEAANYCRNPDKRIGTGPWCYTNDNKVEWEPCGIIRCTECKITYSGTDFLGKETITQSGRVCQQWSHQNPHAHNFTEDDMFPDISVEAASNFCRNPDSRPEGPWCYTMDPEVEWEPCGIIDCQGEGNVECRSSYYGDDYRGHKFVTLSGRQCQHWSSQYPHRHNFTADDFPDQTLEDAANYCRNPDRRLGFGPWCFTEDPNIPWEFCGLPFCYKTEILNTKEGTEYTGVRYFTKSGLICQPWAEQVPHSHPFVDASYFPDDSLLSAQNYCRNPDGRPTGPWCYTLDPNVVSETCGILRVNECRITQRAAEYTGQQAITVSGRICQRWASQSPHPHSYVNATDFPDNSLEDASNYCRNPDNSPTGLWCYTTDPDVVREKCDVPQCDDCKKTYLGTDYTGSRYFTVSGRICQRWDEQNPHQHTFTDSDFPDDTVQQANNYCRNPDRSPDGPWCYTIDPDVEREPCGIKLCMTPGCRQTELGATYRGHHYFTVSGRLCQRWDKQLPHNHTYTDPDLFPDETLSDASNYCRNPDNDPDGPWCYTVEPDQIRETCNIPLCSDCVEDASSSQYTGRRSITSSGRVCQRWDSQIPHSHGTTSADLPDASLEDAANYCRNPDGRSTGPWCYTLDPDVETETCGVPLCTVCRRTYHGYDYAGNASTTISGRPCQRWDKQLPHQHHFVNADFLPDETLSDASNYCRNPDRRYAVGPWCLTEDPDVLWEPCGVPLCKDCKVDEDGTTYAGRRSTTLTNRSCKRWDEVSVSYQSSDFGVNALSELANFCRNPTVGTKSGAGPWCHASTPEEEVVSCGVPLCKDCKETRPGTEYAGKRSTTASGKRCQRWDSQTPNAHSYTSDDDFPDSTVAEASNYCRNPRADGEDVWCYLADETGWEYCNVPYCASTDCTWTFYGQEYRGRYSLTVTGRSCMMWGQYGDQFPHKHGFTDEHFPDASMDEAFNYCRNPNGSKSGLWCFTTDPKVEWEYCPIYSCQDCVQSDRPYSGKRAFTISGIPCQRWDQQLPHRHKWTDADFPQDGSLADASNYCRTPDGATEPWCYTLDPDVRMEKCTIRQCDDCFRTLYGTEYSGTMSSTLSGRTCQEWSKTSPHYHEFTDSLKYPEATVKDAQHYCRNPYQEDTGRIRPWCFTVDPDVEWEYCGIPMCDDAWKDGCVTNETGPDYATGIKYSKYGKPCTNWADHGPVVGRYFELSGYFDKGVFVTDNGTISRDRGLVRSGTCRTAYRKHYAHGGCDSTDWFYSSVETCRVVGRSPEECVNRSAACGSGDACCFQTDLSCGGDVDWASSCDSSVELRHPDDVTSVTSCQFVDQDAECTEMVVRCPDMKVSSTMCCNETCCNTMFNDSAIVHVTIHNDTSLNASSTDISCCPLDGPSPDCCSKVLNVVTTVPGPVCNVTNCTERVEICYYVIDMTGWYLNFSLGRAYDGSRQIRDELYVGCRLSVVEDVSTYPKSEPLTFNKPELSKSYCRNPNEDPDRGLWCYVTDEPSNTWQSCDLPLCPDGAAVEPPPPPTVPPLPEFEYEVVTSTEETTETVPTTTGMTLPSEEETSTAQTTTTTTAPLASSSTNTSSWIARRCDYYLQRTITRYNQTVHKALSKLTLSLLNTKKYDANFTDEPRYAINKTLLQPIQSNFGTRCDWCSPANRTQTVIQSLSERMMEWQQTVAKTVTTDVLEQIQQAASRYFSKDWVANLKHAIITEDIGELQTALRAAVNTTKQALSDTNHDWLRVKEASQLTREFLDYTWKLECNSQLSKLLKEYEHFIKTVKDTLDQFRTYLDAIRVENKKYLQSYRADEMSLHNISSSLRFKDLDVQMQAAKITIDTHMTTGQLLVNSLHLHINQIYYTMLTYMDPESLKASSIYWNYMNTSWSNVSMPSMKDIGGIELPETTYGIEPDESVVARWQEPVLNIANMRKELEDRMADVDMTMKEAKAYFDDYLRENQIDEHFFKKNFLGVEVFCQDMSERRIVENKVYDYPTLLSDVGGVMGLLLGASVITIGEILDLVVYTFAKKCRRKASKKTESGR